MNSTRRSATAAVAIVLAVVVGALGLVGAGPVGAHDDYEVEAGDTLSHIAQRSGVSVRQIMDDNGLTDPDRLRVGQVLRIPGPGEARADRPQSASSSSSSNSTSGATYVVRSGDTLSVIAARAGVTTSALAAANGLSDPNRIRSGATLVVPSGAAGGSSTGTSYADLPSRITSDPARAALIPVFERWAAANGIPVDLLMAVAWQESGWNNGAVSFKGAVGIGQIMPATGEWVASDLIGRPDLDPNDPEDNIRMSARYLDWLIDHHGSEELAIAGYYQGPGAVDRGVMYADTKQYVANVTSLRSRFAAG